MACYPGSSRSNTPAGNFFLEQAPMVSLRRQVRLKP